MSEPALALAILVATVAMFVWGRWRHDMVAAGSLLACVLAGLVSPAQAFSGFGHPAVVTVACVLVLSRGLQASGAVHAIARVVLPGNAGPTASIAALLALAALLSAFMNNIGALALLMPVAMQIAGRLELPPGKLLMPLSFGSILGGTTTLIGTPPNLIVSGIRAEQVGPEGFGMFDFTAVGLPVTLAGLVFIAIAGWRLVPGRTRAGTEGFETGAYLTEARVPEGGKAAGLTVHELEQSLDEAGAQVVAIVRNDLRLTAPSPHRKVREGDVLVLEAEAEALAAVLTTLGLKLEESRRPQERDAAAGVGAGDDRRTDSSGEIALVELAVLPVSALADRSASDLQLRTRYGINLLAVSRQGRRSHARLRSLTLRPGDLLLVQGPPESIAEFAADFSCVPLAERDLALPSRRRAYTAGAILLASVAAAALGVLPAAVSFLAGVLASMALRTVPPRAVYEAVDWPVVVLLACLLPVAGAVQATGAADLVARALLDHLARGDAAIALAVVLMATMLLTDVMNNAATAAVMAPIGLGTAAQLGANPDAFLMAVAIGASCAFLTPIGHQNNTLILGPGGFRFGDYWRLGAPMDLLVVAVAIPALLVAWPP